MTSAYIYVKNSYRIMGMYLEKADDQQCYLYAWDMINTNFIGKVCYEVDCWLSVDIKNLNFSSFYLLKIEEFIYVSKYTSWIWNIKSYLTILLFISNNFLIIEVIIKKYIV